MTPQRAEFQTRLDRLATKRLRQRLAQPKESKTIGSGLSELWQANLGAYRTHWQAIWIWILGVSAFLLLLPVSSYGSYVVLIALYVVHVQRRSRIGTRDVTRLKP